MDWSWELVSKHSYITEGPVWDGRYLFYSEITASRTWIYDPNTRKSTVWREQTRGANGMFLCRAGGLLACEGEGRRIVRYNANEQTEVIVSHFEGLEFNEPNDVVQSKDGTIWFTDPNYGERPKRLPHESVYRVDPGKTAIRVTFDTNRPNGLLLNSTEDELYVAESPRVLEQRRQLRAYQIKPDGSLSTPRILHDFGDGRGIDGMTRTTKGLIVATAGHHQLGPGPMIYVLTSCGRILSTHPTPVDRPTNCIFAEAGLNVLYVTFGGGEIYRVANTGLVGDL